MRVDHQGEYGGINILTRLGLARRGRILRIMNEMNEPKREERAAQNRAREEARRERNRRIWERRTERWNAWKREQREKAQMSADAEITAKQIDDNADSFYTEAA